MLIYKESIPLGKSTSAMCCEREQPLCVQGTDVNAPSLNMVEEQ